MDEQNKQADAPVEQAPQTPPTPPVEPQTAPQPQPQPQVVQQYVVTEKSLQGVSGWLMFWVVVFVLAGIGLLSTFASLLSGLGSGTASDTVIGLIFSPILAIGWLASAVLIILQKRLGILVTLITYGIAALYGVISAVVSFASGSSSDTPIAVFVVGILIGLIVDALLALYFIVSKRVKQTLVK